MSGTYDIDFILEDVVTLPSLPGTVARLMKLVNDPHCSLAAVAEAISADPALTMKTLRLVNSAYYGVRERISTIEHSVVLLGMKVIKNLIFTAAVFDIMKDSADAFLRHSVTCGVTMRVLVEAGPGSVPLEAAEEAFVCGLLHDIGKVVFEQYLPEEYERVAQAALARRIPWHQAEREVIGIDHAELGARLAREWNLPHQLADGIAGHHELSRCGSSEHKNLAAMLSAADYICCACAIVSHDDCVVRLSEDLWDASQLQPADIPSIMERFFEALPFVDELMHLAI